MKRTPFSPIVTHTSNLYQKVISPRQASLLSQKRVSSNIENVKPMLRSPSTREAGSLSHRSSSKKLLSSSSSSTKVSMPFNLQSIPKMQSQSSAAVAGLVKQNQVQNSSSSRVELKEIKKALMNYKSHSKLHSY